jgi:UDP-3-O-[3-hydroxymyristoyl] glucosamine N-acyltransferase
MQVSLTELAEMVGGRLAGDGQTAICGAATLHDVQAGQITFIDQPDKAPQLSGSAAAAAVVPADAKVDGMPVIQVGDVQRAFTAIVMHFRPRRRQRRVGVSPAAFISSTAKIGYDVDIYPAVTIGDDVEIGAGSTIYPGVHILAGCKLGERVTIYPNAVLYEDTQVGDRSIIHAAAVLGADGFGYKLIEGRHQLSAQLGYVEIGPDVEIGAGTTIDRGAYGATRIGAGTKIDDQVMIAHNCRIGRHNLICSQVGIAGSTSTGDYVVMAGQVGVRDHVHIGDRAVLGAMSGIIGDVPADARMLGVPACSEKEQWIKQVAIGKLPELRRQVKDLQRAVDELQQRPTGESRPAAA